MAYFCNVTQETFSHISTKYQCHVRLTVSGVILKLLCQSSRQHTREAATMHFMNSRLTLASDTVRSGPTTNVSESSTQSINFSTAYGHRTCFTQLYKTELYASAYAHIIKAGSGKFQTKVKMKVGTNSLRLVAERSHARCGVQTHDHWSSLL